MSTLKHLGAIGAVLLLSGQAAQAQDVGLALRAGTLGLGGELTVGLSDRLNLRGGGYGFGLDFNATEDDINYDFDLDLLSAGGYVDFHPFAGGFRLTGGVLYVGNDLFAQALPDDGEFDIGDRTFTVAEVGTLTGDLGFNEVAPYAGIGWGNAVSKDGRWAFMVDVGVLFQGRPDVALASTGGTLSGDPLLTDELRREEANLEDDLGLFRFYPVISLGVAYRF